MEREFLVIQHAACEGLGIIGKEFRLSGLIPRYVRAYRGERMPRSVSGYSALVVLGGPMGVYEEGLYPFITEEIRLIESALRDDFPVMGVCLGSQMMARAAGAPVYKGHAKEIGFYRIELTGEGKRDALLVGLPESFEVFQWHGDTFDIPRGATNLASSELFTNQLIRVGRRAYGFQFHFEVTPDMVRGFISAGADELAGLKGSIDPRRILRDAPEKLPSILGYGSTIIRRFLRLVD